LHDKSRIIVNIWIKTSADKIVIIKRLIFELKSYFQKLVRLLANFLQEGEQNVLEDFGSWVIVFEDSMTKSIEKSILVLFAFGQKTWDVFDRANFFKHFEAFFSCSSMLRAPQ